MTSQYEVLEYIKNNGIVDAKNISVFFNSTIDSVRTKLRALIKHNLITYEIRKIKKAGNIYSIRFYKWQDKN